MYCRALRSTQHGLGKGQEEGKIWVWRGHQQEAKYTATSPSSSTSKRVQAREAQGGSLQDKHGKEAEGASPRKQEQPGQYIFTLKQNTSVHI